jgi:hypothetical protein
MSDFIAVAHERLADHDLGHFRHDFAPFDV